MKNGIFYCKSHFECFNLSEKDVREGEKCVRLLTTYLSCRPICSECDFWIFFKRVGRMVTSSIMLTLEWRIFACTSHLMIETQPEGGIGLRRGMAWEWRGDCENQAVIGMTQHEVVQFANEHCMSATFRFVDKDLNVGWKWSECFNWGFS